MKTQEPTPTATHRSVQEYYGKVARQSTSCCGAPTDPNQIQNNLYPLELLNELPVEVVNATAGSGDPISLAKLKLGETVLDLGSGGGLDCFLAARQVGINGKVIGVDMTPEMLEKARANAARMKVTNVEFREGFLEALPVDDNSVDAIISNCVINLAPDKSKVFAEMQRVLKPGGRIALSDMVTNRTPSEEDLQNKEQWCSCTSGALRKSEFVDMLGRVGMVNIRIEPDTESILKAAENGQVRADKDMTLEEIKARLLDDLRNWENTKSMLVAPHKITATKPA
jgi:ubiquinone/menaquinone biosynthesis C-methylase UbiE